MQRLKISLQFFLCFLIIVLFGCSDSSDSSSQANTGNDQTTNDDPAERPFYMGFTPWPYEATLGAIDWTYDTINSNGDMISHHMEEGVPWQESYDNTDFPTEFVNVINDRVGKYISGKKVLLSISPLNMERDGLSLKRGASELMGLDSPWDTYAFNDDEVKTAFLNYASKMIQSFNPDYLVMGVEVNLLIRNNYSTWSAYLDLHQYVFTELKKTYPSLPIGVSVFCVPYFPEWSSEDNVTHQLNGLAEIEPYIDFLAFSVHPFMSALLAESFPENYFRRMFDLTDKPVAISESSYPAQSWQMLSSPFLDFNGSQEKQDTFLSLMMSESKEREALFVIWFSIRDFDALWLNTLGQDEVSLTWRDTGLYDESGNPRDAMNTWIEWYDKR